MIISSTEYTEADYLFSLCFTLWSYFYSASIIPCNLNSKYAHRVCNKVALGCLGGTLYLQTPDVTSYLGLKYYSEVLLEPEQITVSSTGPAPYKFTSIFLFQFWVRLANHSRFCQSTTLHLSPYDSTLHCATYKYCINLRFSSVRGTQKC